MIIIIILYVSGTTKYGDLCRYRTMEKFNKKWDKGEQHQLHDAIQTSTNSKNVEYFHLLRYVNSFLYIIAIKKSIECVSPIVFDIQIQCNILCRCSSHT